MPGVGRGKICLISLILFVLVLPAVARADRGAIYTEPVTLSEPGQKAFLAFNGEEELLVLATDVQAGRDTAVLEFTPFPAEPVVALAPDGAFERLQEILNAHRVTYFRKAMVQSYGEGTGDGEPVDLLLHRCLGVHDVTVVRVNDPAAFAWWVEAYFRENSFPVRELTEQEKEVVADYCQRGFNYFAFDLVHIGKEVQSVPPLAYRFITPALYYPLKVSALYGGTGRVDLVCCGDRRVFDRLDYQLPRTVIANAPPWRSSNRVNLDAAELTAVTPEVAKVLTGSQQLQAFRYEGEFHFRTDVWVDPRVVLVEVNGRSLELEVPPELIAGSCFVPAREVWETLGAAVTWDANRREVVVVKDGLTLRLPVDPVTITEDDPASGQKTLRHRHVAYLNGEHRDLSALAAAYTPGGRAPEVALRITGGRVLLPVRLVAGVLGAKVKWNDEEWKVGITSGIFAAD
ncbi:stalk domain-containing protein [Desulfofundulus sp.]|uniref:stalk domain-containing protein n=1 Tax=Desulfofundulus sp. TaxID=2282750 RepID=UPI003C70AF47